MITKLTEIQEHLKKQPEYKRGSYNGIRTIDVILSYSPCNEVPHCCSTKLCDFKNILERNVSALGLILGSNYSKDGDDAIASRIKET